MIYEINKYDDIPLLEIDNLIIGFFDGIHLGHNKLLNNKSNITILTFDSLFVKKNPIFNKQQRIFQLQNNYDVQNIIIWNLKKYNLTALDFIEKVLFKKLNFKKLIVGQDFKFGSDQKDCLFLKKYINNLEIVSRNSDEISSSKIKQYLINGDIVNVNKNLTTNYYYESAVIKGQQNARKLGYPTANFYVDSNYLIPQDGIYATKTKLNDIKYNSITFIGKPNVLPDSIKHFETHLFNYNGDDFYGQEIKVEFVKKIDDVKQYDSVKQLIAGIEEQVKIVKNVLKD